jgi:glyoxylate/hydroxypyruvate reductase A
MTTPGHKELLEMNSAARIDILSCNLPLAYISAIRARCPEIIVHRGLDAARLEKEIRGTIIAALVWGVTPKNLDLLPALTMVQGLGAGVDHLLEPDVVPPSVPIARVSNEFQAIGMAEYVVLHVLRQDRNLEAIYERRQSRQWGQGYLDHAGARTVGVMGLGNIAHRACNALSAVGFEVRGLSQTAREIEGITCFGTGRLDEFLDGCHHLVCLLPLTRATKGILNSRTFNRLANGSFLINAARGSHLVEADLIPALDSGRLGGATLDVLTNEPPRHDHPFWSDPRILLTGHSAIASALRPENIAPLIAENLYLVARGLQPRNLVDRQRGY